MQNINWRKNDYFDEAPNDSFSSNEILFLL